MRILWTRACGSSVQARRRAYRRCADFEAKRQFLVGHIERVIYDRYKVTIAGSVPVQSASGEPSCSFGSKARSMEGRYAHDRERHARKDGECKDWKGRKRATAARPRTSGRSPYRADRERVGEARRSDGRFGCGSTAVGRGADLVRAGLDRRVVTQSCRDGGRDPKRHRWLTANGLMALDPSLW
jgi:hypothetical protein